MKRWVLVCDEYSARDGCGVYYICDECRADPRNAESPAEAGPSD